MNPADARTDTATHASRLHRAQAMLDRMFRAMPLGGRVRTGIFMALKTVVAASVAYLIGHALHTGQAYWAAISAVAVVQPRFGDTRGAGRDRIVGTAFGGVAGLFGLWIGGAGNLVSFCVALPVVTVACWIFNAGAAARVGGITSAILLLVPNTGPLWETALYRLGEVLLGSACALAIGWLVSRIEERVEGTIRKEDDDAPTAAP
ncbi:FUSC family protein [Luteibacter sp. 9135]|uniref:FUSC family protein n=1 Tax=Luteibacter sp. 9135 TaxID=1500893 RepID=UPI00068DB25A|nr:FUSC family protein [Luteibacter sp. 9135]